MKLYKGLIILSAFFTLLFIARLIVISPVLAGGWPIYNWSWDNQGQWQSGNKTTYIKSHLAPEVPCKGTTVTFKYENPEPGDSVNNNGNSWNYTFTEDMTSFSKFSNKIIPDCNSTATYTSTNDKEKMAIVEYKTADGQTYSSRYVLNFQLSTTSIETENEKYPLPWEEIQTTPTPRPTLPSGTLNVWILDQQVTATNQQYPVTIKYGWPVTDGNVFYNIWGKGANDTDWRVLFDHELGPSTTVNINANEDYSIKVEGCASKLGPCAFSNELFLPKLSFFVPVFIYPKNQQVLDLEGGYMFKVEPIGGTSGYLFQLFQDNVLVYENLRDSNALSTDGEFALWDNNLAHTKFHAGPVKVITKAQFNNQWADAREITINLKPRPTSTPTPQPTSTATPTAAPIPTANPSTTPAPTVNPTASPSAKPTANPSVMSLPITSPVEVNTVKTNIVEEILNWFKSIFPFFK